MFLIGDVVRLKPSNVCGTVGVHFAHEVLSRVGELGARQRKMLCKVPCRQPSVALVDYAAFCHYEQPIEHLEYLVAGLVDRHQDSMSVVVSQLRQEIYHQIGGQ